MIGHRIRLEAFAVAAALLVPGAVHAQNAPGAALPAYQGPATAGGASPVAEPSALPPSKAELFAAARAQKQSGVAKTAVDRRFASDDVTGALGFLCGLGPGPSDKGGAAAYGYDPQGRFLGAKFSVAF